MISVELRGTEIESHWALLPTFVAPGKKLSSLESTLNWIISSKSLSELFFLMLDKRWVSLR